MKHIRGLLLVGAGFAGVPALAQYNYDSHGFESPYFSPGDINGQDGWIRETGTGTWGTCDIVAGQGTSGSQGVVDGDQAGAAGAGAYHLLDAGPASFMMDVDFRIGDDWLTGFNQTSSVYLFAMGVTDTNAYSFAVRGIKASNTFDGFQLLYPGGSASVSMPLENLIDQYHHMTLTWSNSSRVASFYLDGTLLLSSTIGSGYNLGTFDFLTLGDVRGDSLTTGHFDWDNFTYAGVPTPEPAGIAALAPGLAVLSLRTRKKKHRCVTAVRH